MRFRFGWPLAVLAVVLSTIVVTPRAEALVFVNTWGTQGDGPGQFETPLGITASPNGYVYVADTGNWRIQKFDATGSFIGSFGSSEGSGQGDGELNLPGDVASDFAGNLYVADTGNNRIQKFGPSDQFLAKWGTAGSAPGRFNQPSGVAVGPTGMVYVADSGNNRVQKFDAGGNFVLQWGGPGTATGQFQTIAGIAVDFTGNVYVADSGNNRIQKFDSNGAFLTSWGTMGTGSGQFRQPYDVAVESSGTVHVSDMNNNRIQSFTSAGAFLESTGAFGTELGLFRSPTGLAVDAADTVLVTDTVNHRVQATGPGTAIIVTKDSVPDDPLAFTYTTSGFAPSFYLVDNPNSGLRTRAFEVAPGSGYSVAETVPLGWDLMSATCSDGSSVSNIDVEQNEQVHCTFANRKRGWIEVVQETQPDAPQDFSFTAGGGLDPSTFTLDDDGDLDNGLSNKRTFGNLVPGGGYSVTQANEPGWGAAEVTCSDGSSPDNIDVAPGEVVRCTFVNTADNAGRITIVKDTQPDDPQDFTFHTGGGLSPSVFLLDDDGDDGNGRSSSHTFVVFPGSGYSVAEAVPPGWIVGPHNCSDGSPTTNIAVSAGETVACTVVNRRRGNIVVVEDSQPNDPQDFSYTGGGGLNPTPFTLDDDSNAANGTSNTLTFSNVAPGSGYSVTQAAQAGWETATSCSDGSPIGNIDVAYGETVTCTFTNRKRGRIVVRKDAQPDDPQDFSFTAGGGLSPSSFVLDDDGDNGNGVSNTQTFDDLTPQAGYSVSESALPDWVLSSACSDGSPPSNVNVAPGEIVTCTFTNRKRATLAVVLDTQPDDPQDFSFTAGGGLSPSSFSLDDDGDNGNGLSTTRTFTGLTPGSGYSVAQQGLPSWLQESATCSDGSSPSSIDLAPAENVTCTFVTSHRARIVIVKDARPNNIQVFDFVTGGGLSPATFQLDDDGNNGNALSNSRAFTVAAGSGYSVAEQTPPGEWVPEGATCSDGSQVSGIGVSQGEIVTCTFVNRLQSYPRPRGASPLRASLVPAYRQCTSPTAMHGAPLAHPSCPIVPASNYLTQGSPDANGAGANGQSFITLKVRPYVPGPPDDGDVRVIGTLTDIRCLAATSASVCSAANAADGPDYSGELQVALTPQITDTMPIGTTMTFSFPVRVTCANSASTSLGSTCSMNTTFNAIVPGAVREDQLAIWSLDAVKVMDGGPDGSVQTADNTLYMSQGIFVP